MWEEREGKRGKGKWEREKRERERAETERGTKWGETGLGVRRCGGAYIGGTTEGMRW